MRAMASAAQIFGVSSAAPALPAIASPNFNDPKELNGDPEDGERSSVDPWAEPTAAPAQPATEKAAIDRGTLLTEVAALWGRADALVKGGKRPDMPPRPPAKDAALEELNGWCTHAAEFLGVNRQTGEVGV